MNLFGKKEGNRWKKVFGVTRRGWRFGDKEEGTQREDYGSSSVCWGERWEDGLEKFYELMPAMKVLECEKQKAEFEAHKFKGSLLMWKLQITIPTIIFFIFLPRHSRQFCFGRGVFSFALDVIWFVFVLECDLWIWPSNFLMLAVNTMVCW